MLYPFFCMNPSAGVRAYGCLSLNFSRTHDLYLFIFNSFFPTELVRANIPNKSPKLCKVWDILILFAPVVTTEKQTYVAVYEIYHA